MLQLRLNVALPPVCSSIAWTNGLPMPFGSNKNSENSGLQSGDSITAVAQQPKVAVTDRAIMCYSGGGDFVLPGVEEYQILHGDMQMNPDDVRMPPPFLSVNFCVQALTSFNRDVRILHGGTPNWSEQTRYLPSIEYVSGELRAEKDPEMFPPSRSIPWYVYETLPERVQHLCQELVAEKADPGCPDPDDRKPWESIYWHGAQFRRTCHD